MNFSELHRKPVAEVKSCPTLWDPMDYRLPGSSVHGIFQAIVLEWVAISFSRGSSWPRDRTWVSHIVDRHFTVWATGFKCAQKGGPDHVFKCCPWTASVKGHTWLGSNLWTSVHFCCLVVCCASRCVCVCVCVLKSISSRKMRELPWWLRR